MNSMKKIVPFILAVIIGILQMPALNANAKADKTDYSAVFDATYYAQHNPDLAAAGIKTNTQLKNHFINHGMKEGRQGSEEFNVQAYKARYADLRMAYGDDLKKYYLHYINSGKAEGRNGRADGAVLTTPVTPVNPSTPTSNGTKYTTPLYPLYDTTGPNGKEGAGWGSWLTVKAGQSNGYWTAKQTDVDKANYNPYGLTEGYSVLTGYAKIGDIRYLNFSNTSVHMKMNNLPQISYKMECYAINKNGVPLFRQYGSYFNVYTQGKDAVPLIDAITPSMTVYDVQKLFSKYPIDVSWTTHPCTAIANYKGAIFGQLLIENYHLMSDVQDHEECFIYIGDGKYICGSDAHIVTVEEYRIGYKSVPGTYYVNHYSVK